MSDRQADAGLADIFESYSNHSRYSVWDTASLPVSFGTHKRRQKQTLPIRTDVDVKAREKSRSRNPGLQLSGKLCGRESDYRDWIRPDDEGINSSKQALPTHRRAWSAAPAPLPPYPNPPQFAPVVKLTPLHVIQHLPYGPIRSQMTSPVDTGLTTTPQSLYTPTSELGSSESGSIAEGLDNPAFRKELEARWILNLSLAFRDKSDREKFFVTFAESSNLWRRVTVSCDYRNAPADSLEADLRSLRFQRDKSAHVYEAIRDSLSNVQFYDTVTNLKLETLDNRLHVHVREDVSEIIQYPPISSVQHLNLKQEEYITESSLHFVAHISGFVYRVETTGLSYIKKEIPGPDMVDEFLYEINALCKLRDSPYIINFQALVIDDNSKIIKGLLIEYAPCGALADLIYDHKIAPLSWLRRERWIKQIVSGLHDLHDAGFVHGDVTLSNIVIDDFDDAKIIDINRRGCPVGWEPPEFLGLIHSGQKISMYIGTKSDLYQLGMVLWALSVNDDEPERAETPLSIDEATKAGAPPYLKNWIMSCLSPDPSSRVATKDMLVVFDLQDQPFSYNQPRLEKQQRQAPYQIPILDSCNKSLPQHSGSRSSGGDAVAEPEPLTLGPNDSELGTTLPIALRALETGASTSPHYKLGYPIHQDSGFEGGYSQHSDCRQDDTIKTHTPILQVLSESALPCVGAGRYSSFDPPLHQDSGFHEDDYGKPILLHLSKLEAQNRFPIADDFAGIGAAHTYNAEEGSIHVA